MPSTRRHQKILDIHPLRAGAGLVIREVRIGDGSSAFRNLNEEWTSLMPPTPCRGAICRIPARPRGRGGPECSRPLRQRSQDSAPWSLSFIPFKIRSTSSSSASLRRLSQVAQYQITGCISTHRTSTSVHSIGRAFTSSPMTGQLIADSTAQQVKHRNYTKRGGQPACCSHAEGGSRFSIRVPPLDSRPSQAARR